MSVHLIESIQQNLNYPALRKIDPNSQEAKHAYEQSSDEKFAQAAIPAVLAGLYRLTRTESGTEQLLNTSNSKEWLNLFFNGKQNEAVHKVSQYSSVSEGHAANQMELIADEAVFILKEKAGKEGSVEKVKHFMNDQRHGILVYLPAALGIGDLVNDEALDDRTNKMEGPISNLVHKIEDKLSGGDAR